MDWKDHIITQTDCRTAAKLYVPFATEAFLVTLANKGLYKRALKDLEAVERIELKETEGKMCVAWEEVEVTLQPNVSQSTCNCPSKIVCKHLLMAVLTVSEYAQAESSGEAAIETRIGTATETAENPRSVAGQSEVEQSVAGRPEDKLPEVEQPEPWQEIKKVDITALRKQAGKKLFEDTLRLIQEGWTADFTESDMLEATINTENITIYFPRQNSLEHAVCKCGNTGLCKHKLIAILSYMSKEGLLTGQTDGQPTISLITEETQALLRSGQQFVAQILGKGIITCGDNEVEKAIRYSIHMDSCGIGNLANLFRSLSTDLEYMQVKHVGFSQRTTFAILSRLYNTIRFILQNTQDNERLSNLIESSRSEYYTTPVGTFTGLGAAPWQTRSGYFGITAYFFYHEKQVICTYTISLADYYEQTEKLATMENLTRQYHRSDHWANGHSLSSLSQSHFTLRNFKLNRLNRLSSSAQTQCELTGKTTIDDWRTMEEDATLRKCSEEDELLKPSENMALFKRSEEVNQVYHYFRKRPPERVVLIPFSKLTEMRFDPVEQELSFTMQAGVNSMEGDVSGVLPYNTLTKDAIKRLERILKDQKPDSFQFMVCQERPGKYIPISLIQHTGVDNFYFI